MVKKFKKFAVVAVMSLCAFGFATSQAIAGPPDHAGGPSRGQVKANETEDVKWVPPGLQKKEKSSKGIPPGLQKKGGLPPGLQGRDNLPPGIQKRFGDVLEREDEEKEVISHVVVKGDEFIVIPNEDEVIVKYEAFLLDEEGTKVEITPEWSLEEEKEGVYLDEEGTLEITNSAEEGTFKLVATYSREEDRETKEYKGTLEVELYHQEISYIEIDGKKFVGIDEDEEGRVNLEYVARVMDQNDKAIEGEVVSWEVKSEDIEDLFALSTAKESRVVVIFSQEEGEFTVTAKVGEEEITLQVVVYNPVATDLEVSGAKEIVLPSEDEKTTEEYEARLLDQYGEKIETEDITWFLTDKDGKEIETSYLEIEEGKLTVTDEVSLDYVFIWAAFNDEIYTTFKVDFSQEQEEEEEE